MAQSRSQTLRAIAHRIAVRSIEASRPYFEKGGTVPKEILAHEFATVCASCTNLRGGPLTEFEMQQLLVTLVPAAVAKLDRRIGEVAEAVDDLVSAIETAKGAKV
jgi:hypothetical protein